MVEAQTNKAVRRGGPYDEEYIKQNGALGIAVQKVPQIYRHLIEMECPGPLLCKDRKWNLAEWFLCWIRLIITL